MTDAVRQACRELAAACEFDRLDDIDRYLAAIAVLRKHPSPAVLDVLLDSLRDHEGGEVQYELVEACEAYPVAVYLTALVAHSARLRRVAPQWGRLMLQSVLNATDNHEPLEVALGSCGEAAWSAALSWVAEIAAEEPDYQELFERLAGEVE